MTNLQGFCYLRVYDGVAGIYYLCNMNYVVESVLASGATSFRAVELRRASDFV